MIVQLQQQLSKNDKNGSYKKKFTQNNSILIQTFFPSIQYFFIITIINPTISLSFSSQ